MHSHNDIRSEMIALLPRLRAFGWSLTRDRTKADDLVQQACEKALRNLASYTPGTRLDSWMFRIMRNAWIDDRRAPRHLELASDITEIELTDERSSEQLHDRMELKAVERALSAMEQEQREVLLLVGVQGLRYREAAEALELPIGTVMSRLSRARRALAAMIGRGEPTAQEGKLR